MRILNEQVVEIKPDRRDCNCVDYNKYITAHIKGVVQSYQMLENQGPSIDKDVMRKAFDLCSIHDESKWGKEEYDAYADYFYRKEKTPEVELAFDLAWNHHQKCNPHHWQYWVLVKDSGGQVILDMPLEYIIEMACDWQSFSLKNSESTAYNWYQDNKSKMMLSDTTRSSLEDILEYFKQPLERRI